MKWENARKDRIVMNRSETKQLNELVIPAVLRRILYDHGRAGSLRRCGTCRCHEGSWSQPGKDDNELFSCHMFDNHFQNICNSTPVWDDDVSTCWKDDKVKCWSKSGINKF